MSTSRSRTELGQPLVTSKELSLARLKRDGKASAARIAAFEAEISRTSRLVLSEWFDQAHRLAVARAQHGKRGAAFREFAVSIRVDGRDAFRLEGLDGHRDEVFAMCEALENDEPEYRWPGWRKALEMIASSPKSGGYDSQARMANRWPSKPNSVRGFGGMFTHQEYSPRHHIYLPREPDPDSVGDEWRTPTKLFSFLNPIFGFTVDVAASKETALCERYWTKDTDGLAQIWQPDDVHWMNCPYSEAGLWVRKADEGSKRGVVTVALLPHRSATGWYRDYLVPSALKIELHGRVPFYRQETRAQEIEMSGAPFASILAVWPRSAGKPLLKFTKPVHAVIMEIPS